MMREPGNPFNTEPQENKTNPSYQELETSKYLSKELGGKGKNPEVTTESTKEISSIENEIKELQEKGKDDKRTKDRIKWLEGMLEGRKKEIYR